MLFEELVLVSEAIAQTKSRLAKVEQIARFLRALFAESAATGGRVEAGIAYLAGELPNGRIGLGPAVAFGETPAGAESTPVLTLAEVDEALMAIGQVRGKGANLERARLWRGLLERATPREQSFLRRLVVGELRQGALESVVADGVSKAAQVDPASLRRALMLSGSLPEVSRAAFEAGQAGLARYRIQLFRPLLPMLAQAAATPEEALARISPAVFEYKLDGVRLQVHKREREVRIYTRQLRDVTRSLPEVVNVVRALPAESLILDGEVLSIGADGTPDPFQVTMRRMGRKLDVEEQASARPLEVFFFDCLHRDGQDLIDRPGRERLAQLDAAVPGDIRVPRLVTADPAEADAFFEGALEAGHEGVMAKELDAPYAAGRRGQSWLKIKSHHTFDLVVLAVEWGSGRRTGWLSNLHLGARDENGGFVMVGKTFKGLSDDLLRWQTEALLARETAREGHVVTVRPELVVEVRFNDVQQSPHYPGGVALRFARVRRYRPDKAASEADTIDALRSLCPSGRMC